MVHHPYPFSSVTTLFIPLLFCVLMFFFTALKACSLRLGPICLNGVALRGFFFSLSLFLSSSWRFIPFLPTFCSLFVSTSVSLSLSVFLLCCLFLYFFFCLYSFSFLPLPTLILPHGLSFCFQNSVTFLFFPFIIYFSTSSGFILFLHWYSSLAPSGSCILPYYIFKC